MLRKLTATATHAVLHENDPGSHAQLLAGRLPAELQGRFRNAPVEMLSVTETSSQAYGLFAARPYESQGQYGVLRKSENPALATRWLCQKLRRRAI